jgi:hypothetical protein
MEVSCRPLPLVDTPEDGGEVDRVALAMNNSTSSRGSIELAENSSKGADQAPLKPSKGDSNNGLEYRPRFRSRGKFQRRCAASL